MGVITIVALPPRVLAWRVYRLQCGAARAGMRRGRGECAELAHLAPRAFTSGFTLDMLKNGRFLRGLGRMAGSQNVCISLSLSLRRAVLITKRGLVSVATDRNAPHSLATASERLQRWIRPAQCCTSYHVHEFSAARQAAHAPPLGRMKTAVVTPLTLLSNTLRSADSTLTMAPSLPWQSTCACDAISATHPLTSGTSPCDWRQSP